MSLKLKIIVTALAIFFAIALTLVMTSYYDFKNMTAQMIKEAQVAQSGEVAAMLDAWTKAKKNSMDVLGKKLASDGDSFLSDVPSHQKEFALVSDAGSFGMVYFGADSDGSFYQSQDVEMPADYDPRKRPWYDLAKTSEKVLVTEPYVDVTTGDLCLSFVKQININENFAGVLGSDIYLKDMVTTILSKKNGQTGYTFVMGKDGTFLIHPDESLVMKKKITDIDPALSTVMSDLGKQKSGFVTYNDNGTDRLLAYTEIPELGWVACVTIEKSEVYAPIVKKSFSLILISILPILIGSLLFYALIKKLFEPIKKLIERLKAIAEGDADLTHKLDEDRSDELGEMARQFNKFLGRMRNIMVSVSDLSGGMTKSISELSSTVGKISGGLHSQTDETNGVAVAVEEMNQTITQIAESANDTSSQANATIDSAKTSKEAVLDTVAKMNDIALNVRESSDVIKRLGDSSTEIGEILNVINDIADQTNLLALNAAIEAARAGEAGRGFAVVADEVRKLAERTQSATKEISDMITVLQQESKDAVVKVASGVEQVTDGTRSADRAEKAISEILDKTYQTTDMVNRIAAAAEEQAATTTEIARNVDKINNISSQNSSELAEISEFAKKVYDNAEELLAVVRQFKLH